MSRQRHSQAETAIPVGSGPSSGPAAIAITPAGTMAYVVNQIDGTVSPIDLITRTALTPIHVGPAPLAIAVWPG